MWKKTLWKLSDLLPARVRNTLVLRAFAFSRIPLIYHLRPTVEQLDDERCVVRLRLGRRTEKPLHQGHVLRRSVHRGRSRLRADDGPAGAGQWPQDQLLVPGLPGGFSQDRLRRHFFTFEDADKARDLVRRASESFERVDDTLSVVATVPDKYGDEPVARFELTLSLKQKRTRGASVHKLAA